jgi:3-oxoacyl-[acyl-carrier-protein] synthase-3
MSRVHAAIEAIEYYLPEAVLSTSDLAKAFPGWSIEKIDEKTGIHERHIAAPDECASDLGVAAARKLFNSGVCQPDNIDFILFCTQSPDYFLPTTACLLQDRLGIPTSAGALDFNLGCSGFIYGLGLAEGLVSSGQARRILLITAETYSKFIHDQDRSVRTIFGDGAAATLIGAIETDGAPPIGPFVYGTDGSGGPNLMVPTGAARTPRTKDSGCAREDETGNVRSGDNLVMNGPEVFNFTISAVPQCVSSLLAKAQVDASAIDLFVFHQANRYMLEHLRKRMKIPQESFYVHMSDCGNTVSSTIPIALKHAHQNDRLQPGMTCALVGFGVGYSWGGALMRWTAQQ